MPRYASGKHALGISDRSGRTYKLKNMIKEWNGFFVGRDEFESKQPQLQPRRVLADPQAIKNSRPDRTEPPVEVLLPFNSFKSGSSGSSTITVNEPGHGRSTGDVVRFRSVESFDGFTETVIEGSSGFSITKVDNDNYTFISGSGTATSGDTKGGGGFASAGPVTVSA
tara:strand:+ start:372 stop:875 length:504 start_codon:yes stop_codon:yes gene_type:complete